MSDQNTELNIDDVVQLEPDQLDDTQKSFLEANKDQLTTDELQKFGFEVKPVEPTSRQTPEPPKPNTPEKGDTGAAPGADDDKVRGVINEYMTPYLKQQQEQQNRIEIDSFLAANPDYSKYKSSIEKHVADPAYARIPVDRIAKMVAADDLMKIGARRERETQRRADSTRNNMNGARNTNANQKDWGSASKEDFEAKRAEVLGRR